MNIKTLILTFLFAVSGIVCAGDAPHTPKPGSEERQSICDGARPFVMKEYVSSKKLPQPLLFKIERMNVLGNYCSFQATPVFKDGSPVSTDHIMDIVFDFCLKKTGDTWEVIYDLSSTDVPSDTELKQMWNDFPKDFPSTLIPEFWRNHFNRVK
jgi:hypothetical protein